MSAIDTAIIKYNFLIPPDRVQQIRRDAQLLLDGTPCNESRGWYGTKPKPGCKRDKAKTAAKKAAKKSSKKVKKTSKAAKTISPKNVVSLDKNFSAKALNKALDAIQSEGAADRIAVFKDIVSKQGIQTVFNTGIPGSTAALLRGIENKGSYYNDALADYENAKAISQYAAQAHADNLSDIAEAIAGDNPNTQGYTRREIRHVVIQPHKQSAKNLKLDPWDLDQAAQEVYDRVYLYKEPPIFSVSTATQGSPAVFAIYLHEVGHQILLAAQHSGVKLRPPPLKSGITEYSTANIDEQFAEHFALWMLDANRLKSAHPKMHSYVEKTVKAAQQAGRRIP